MFWRELKMGWINFFGGCIVFWGEIFDMLFGIVGDVGDGKRIVGWKGDYGCGY